MTRRLHRVALTLMLLSGIGGAAWAQNVKLQPGLWEVQVTMKSSSGQMEAAMAQMQEQLAHMPAEQRQQMQQMMAAQGVSLNGRGQGHTVKFCMTQRDADADNMQARAGCTHNSQRVSGHTVHMSFSCPGTADEPPSSGDGTLTLASPKAYSGQFTLHTTANGKPETMQLTHHAKWLAADCGSTQPLSTH